MITIEQCRGARGVLGWTQQDLADFSGLSKTAINNFEKGHSDIKTASLKAIQMALETAGIEFLGLYGLQKKAHSSTVLSGENRFNDLFYDVYESPLENTNEVLIFSPRLNFFENLSKSQLLHINNSCQNGTIKNRIICLENQKPVHAIDRSLFKYVPETHAAAYPSFYIYNSKVAFELWDNSMIIVIESDQAHHAEKNRFEHLWNHVATHYSHNMIDGDDTTQKTGST